jgi:hypothetical protein
VEGSFHSSFSRIAVMLNLKRRKEIGKATEELDRYVLHRSPFFPLNAGKGANPQKNTIFPNKRG